MTGKQRLSIKVTTGSVPDLLARRAYETMHDGRWHDIEEVIADLGRLVPPGVAARRQARNLKATRQTRVNRGETSIDLNAPSARPRTRDQQIASGRRSIVREFLSTGIGFDKSADGFKIRMLRMPHSVKSDRLRGETIQPLLDGLVNELTVGEGDPLAEDRIYGIVQRTAHEWGVHLASCPKGCELLPLNKPVIVTDDDDSEEG